MRRLLCSLLLLLVPLATPAASLEGRPAPALALEDPAGAKHTLAEITNGRPAVVLFWASWCPYCKALFKPLRELVAQYGNDRIVVVAVNVWEDDEADAREIIAAGGYPFTFLMGGSKQTKKWGMKGTPGLYVVDRAGRVVYDRTARPLKAVAGAPADAPVRKETLEQSCMRWLDDVRTVLDSTLAEAVPTPVPAPS